jgi:hypothetical protein
MATATDFSGLLGGILTPEEQQQQQTEAKALQFAQLSPAQQLAFMGYTSGRQLGQGLAQAAGVDIQDPTIKRASTMRQLAQGIDVTSVEGLKQYAQRLQQAGLTEEAAKLIPRILSMQESLSKQFQQSSAGTASLASAAKSGADVQDITDKRAAKNARVQMLINAGMTDAEAQGIASNDTAFAKFVENKRIATPPEYAVQGQALGFGAKPYLSDYTADQIKEMEKGVFKHKAGVAAAGATAIKIPLGEAMTTAFNIADKKEAGKEWAKLGPIYVEGNNTLSDLSKFKETAQTGFTGTGAGAKLALSKALGSLGVNIGTKASDTEISDAISSQLVQRIAKVFPGSQSNKELDQLLKSKPNIQQELPTILRLISKMETEIKAQQLTYEQGSKLSPEERATKFNPNIATARNYNMLNRYNTLSEKYRNNNITDAERAEAKKIKEELGL